MWRPTRGIVRTLERLMVPDVAAVAQNVDALAVVRVIADQFPTWDPQLALGKPTGSAGLIGRVWNGYAPGSDDVPAFVLRAGASIALSPERIRDAWRVIRAANVLVPGQAGHLHPRAGELRAVLAMERAS